MAGLSAPRFGNSQLAAFSLIFLLFFFLHLQMAKGAFTTGKAYLAEGDEDDMLDFLDARAGQKIRAQLPKKSRELAVAGSPFARTKDGRLYIAEDPDDPRTKLKHKGSSMAAGVMDTSADAMFHSDDDDGETSGLRDRTRIGRKRRHNSDDEHDDDDDDDDAHAADNDGQRSHKSHRTTQSVERRSLGGESRKTAMSRRSEAAASRLSNTENKGGQWRARGGPASGPAHKKLAGAGGKPVSLGTEYRSKKAAGDMRKKDAPAPYAYLPFDARQINRRQQTRAAGDMKALFKNAKDSQKQARVHGNGHRGKRE
jgi:hypothetical protein